MVAHYLHSVYCVRVRSGHGTAPGDEARGVAQPGAVVFGEVRTLRPTAAS